LIRFRVDGRSAVPPYQQIVQQVRQALRMGVLTVGDQLPSVREVVAGLVEARAGHGTFVRGRPPGPPPGTHARLGRKLATWLREARAAGLDDEAIESLVRATLQAAEEEDIA
jgi:GntR family transcriptional regulator